MIMQIALKTPNGSYLVAEGGGGRELLANRADIGPWETFRLFNRSRPGQAPQQGDQLVLQAWNGRFVTAVGGGGGTMRAELAWTEAATLFTIERIAGSGTIRSGNQVALRAANGNYVVAEGGGGTTVNANRPLRGPWETFRIQLFQPQLIRLRASTGRYVTAVDGGASRVTARREEVTLWETFSLVNFSRADRSLRTGDSIALRAWNGNYVRCVVPDAVDVRANQASPDALFRLGAPLSGAIEDGQRLTLQSRATSRFVAARAGEVVADSTALSDEAFFTVELAEQAGMGMQWAPSGGELARRPMSPPPQPVSGVKRVLVLHIYDDVHPPLSATNAQIAEAIFGARPSVADWFRTMSGGACTLANAGVFGPIHTPFEPTLSQVLTAAEEQGVPLAALARDGVIDGRDITLIRLGVGAGGQRGSFDEVSSGGVRYRGGSAGIGVSPDVNEGSRMVIAHECTHIFLDTTDRYHLPFPVRGDVIATRETVGAHESFVIERLLGAGTIRSGDRVTLRAHNRDYLAYAGAAPNFVNLEDVRADSVRIFTIAALAGTDEIASGSQITLRSTAGRYVTAEYGGGGVLTANRTAAREWEQFEIRKTSGSGLLASGDQVSLRSSKGLFVAAEPNTRDQWELLADHERSAMYKWRETNAGQSAGFDNATSNNASVMLSLFDRIRHGWVIPKYLTPDNRGCYLLRPFLEHREALILFDPHSPAEWYTIENRLHTANVDEVPSNGLVVSWIHEDQGYWQWWFNRVRDTHTFDKRARYPVVLSAAAMDVPPNPFAGPRILAHEWLYKRNHPNAAFRNQELVLPLGHGDPSRFHLSFHQAAGNNVAVCVR